MTSPDASVPELRKRSRVMVLVLVAALLVVGGIVVVVAMNLKVTADPGGAACDQVEQQAEMGSAPWDAYIDVLVATVEKRVKSGGEATEPIKIKSTKRDDRCRETMRKLQKALPEQTYHAIASCIAGANQTRQAMKCIEAIP